ncbi:hypothetical protein ACFW04_014586 [Cataglyphis niger]
MAILCCAQRLLANKEKSRRISICSDIQTALEALTVTSKLIWDCRCILEELARDNEVALVWIPGHSDIRSNEAADQLARVGSEAALVGPEPAVVISCSLGKGEIVIECRQAKVLLGDSPSEGLVNYIKRLADEKSGLVIHILTGHGTLNCHSHKLGINMRPN